MRIQEPRSIYMEFFNKNSYRLVINYFHKKSPSHMMFGRFLNVPLVGHCTKKKFPVWIWSHFLKKSLMENFIFCEVGVLKSSCF